MGPLLLRVGMALMGACAQHGRCSRGSETGCAAVQMQKVSLN